VGDVAIAGANAIIVAPGDLSAAAVAIGQILADPELAAAMSQHRRAIDAAAWGADVEAFARAVRRAGARSGAVTGSTPARTR
jgi:glycosyltransferase involved in cell wall biosynthesis